MSPMAYFECLTIDWTEVGLLPVMLGSTAKATTPGEV